MEQELRVSENFDLVCRTITLGKYHCAVYCISGFTKSELLEKLLEAMMKQADGKETNTLEDFSQSVIPFAATELLGEYETAILNLLSGQTVLFIDGFDRCIVMDCRSYPARSVSEPEKDKTLRGSKDGFVETLILNAALIRRRIRDPLLTIETLHAGRRSMTDIALCYIEDRIDRKMLDKIREKIKCLDVDSLTMNQQSLAECLYPYKWYNPFPKFKFTERPDTAAASVLEGNLVVLVDNSPSAMVLPSSVFDIIEEADD